MSNSNTSNDSAPSRAGDQEATGKLLAAPSSDETQTQMTSQSAHSNTSNENEERIPEAGTKISDPNEGTELLATNKERPWQQWYVALKESFPTYSAIHIAFFITTVFASLFILKDFSGNARPISSLWESWHHWDTGIYMAIARVGYDNIGRTPFFPLFPLLTRIAMFIFQDSLISALFVSNVLGAAVLMILYRIVKEDFDSKVAQRTILYLSIFPTAFFLAAGYTESTFLFMTLLMFYNLRKGNWWIAGFLGLLASIARSSGLLLALPFYYEYLRQHDFTLTQFKFRNLRRDLLAGLLIPLGLALFALFCYWKFNDPLAFSHQEAYWGRSLTLPWNGLAKAITHMSKSGGALNFLALRTAIDVAADLLALILILLMVVGPWRFKPNYWSYFFYAGITYLFFMLLPATGDAPLQSTSRYVLALFPIFIILARMGKNRTFHISYIAISGTLLFFLLTQFLTGHWVL